MNGQFDAHTPQLRPEPADTGDRRRRDQSADRVGILARVAFTIALVALVYAVSVLWQVNLTGHCDRFLAAQVTSGRFKNASEVMRAGLHLLEQQNRAEEEELALLRALAATEFGELNRRRGTANDGPRQLQKFIGQVGARPLSLCPAS
jgi:antitoxin ParD1/3/4